MRCCRRCRRSARRSASPRRIAASWSSPSTCSASVPQLAYGPLADRLGRKQLLIGCMIFYAGFAAPSGPASSFVMLLAARTLHGIAAAGARVLVVAVVRDRFEGAAMAQVMSTAMIVFMLAPVIA